MPARASSIIASVSMMNETRAGRQAQRTEHLLKRGSSLRARSSRASRCSAASSAGDDPARARASGCPLATIATISSVKSGRRRSAPIRDRVDQDREIDAAVEQRLDRPIGRVGRHVDRDARMLALKRREQRAEPVVAGIALRADPDDAVGVAGEPPDVLFGALDVAEDAARRLEDAAPGRGQHHPPAEADEEGRVERAPRCRGAGG